MRGERLEKAKKISNKVFKKYHGFNPRNEKLREVHKFSKEMLSRFLGTYRKTKVPCSCWMCGNPRKYEGKTRQEKKKEIVDDDI